LSCLFSETGIYALLCRDCRAAVAGCQSGFSGAYSGIDALMRSGGAACLAIVVLMLVILFIPFRQGPVWAKWSLPVADACLLIAGLVFSLMGRKTRP